MPPRGEFSVSVTKDYLVFASAHFITFAGHRCEGLHGHNYRVRVTVEGALDQDTWFVFDFVVLLGGGWLPSLDASASHGGCNAATR